MIKQEKQASISIPVEMLNDSTTNISVNLCYKQITLSDGKVYYVPSSASGDTHLVNIGTFTKVKETLDLAKLNYYKRGTFDTITNITVAELTTDLASAINNCLDKYKQVITRLWCLNQEGYNPYNNVEEHTHIVGSDDGTSSSTIAVTDSSETSTTSGGTSSNTQTNNLVSTDSGSVLHEHNKQVVDATTMSPEYTDKDTFQNKATTDTGTVTNQGSNSDSSDTTTSGTSNSTNNGSFENNNSQDIFRYGNIGVTKATDLIMSTIETEKYLDLYNICIEIIKKELLIYDDNALHYKF